MGVVGRGAAASLTIWLAACAGTRPTEPVEPVAVDATWPLDTAAYRTTSATIYLGNLDARIDMLRTRSTQSDAPRLRSTLAGSLYHRYRVLGRLADAEEAATLIDAAVAAEPDVAEHRQLRAIIRAGFHRFGAALDDLDAASHAGAPPEALQRTRRDIQLALGDYAALRQELRDSGSLSQDFDELAHRADLRLLLGDATGSEFLYRAAQAQYRDVNPVPLAWLHVQQGIALLRQERVAEARRFFAAAHARIPQYYLATEHLAECETRLGNYDAARTLYRDVIAQTGNPEFIAALAGLERQAGNDAEAERLNRDAEAAYSALMARYPDAFGQHAAEFLIEIGQGERADALAQSNLALRHDIGSWILMAQTALAVGDVARACAARAQAVQTALRPPELAELDALAPRCR